MSHRPLFLGASVAALMALGSTASADFVILDDLIVDGSACIGFDCVNGESFGFDTIRLKENNLRIKFEDTSSTASFPSTDWTLVANDSANGGQNKFSILDSSTNRTVVTFEGNAPSNSLYVDDGGRVGFGTSIPVADLHVKTGNTPTLRLEQDGTSGFSTQTFDVASNEANFFVRDATNGSTLPFRIRPGAPSNVLYIDPDGDVGISHTNPTGALHIDRSDGTAKLIVEETQEGFSTQIEIMNDGAPRMQFDNTASVDELWQIGLADPGDDFLIRHESTAGAAGNVFRLTSTGALTILGALTQNSDKNNKMAIEPLDTDEILAKVTELPLSSWTYKHDAEAGIRHIGPMAQDFYALFGTGASEKGISTIDTAGVALAAIQALTAQNAELLARIESLEAELSQEN